jgi:hypothetical protein
VSTDEIRAELRALRSGHAVHRADLTARLGTNLRMLCDTGDATPAGDPSVLRQRLISELNAHARRLPDDLATAARAGLGLHLDAQYPQFQQRVAWLARYLGREDRTALRRIDDAEVLLAEQISQELARRRSAPHEDGWHVARLKILVRLDTPTVEVYEERRIVADRDGLDEVGFGVNLPAEGPRAVDVHTEVRYGARLIRQERPLPRRCQMVIALPRPVRAGHSHDFCQRFLKSDPQRVPEN